MCIWLLEGISMVEVSRIKGEHFPFRDFYEKLTAILEDVMMTGPTDLPGSNIIHTEPITTDGISPMNPDDSRTLIAEVTHVDVTS